MRLEETPEGEAITWGAKIGVRECAADRSLGGANPVDRMRLRIGSGSTLDGDGAYPEVGAESQFGGAFTDPQGLDAGDWLPIYSTNTALGVPANRIIAYARKLLDGTPYGTYFPFTVFPHTEGGLVFSETGLGTVEKQNITKLADDRVAIQARKPFKVTFSNTYVDAMIEDAIVDFGIDDEDEDRYIIHLRTDRGAGSDFRVTADLYDRIRGAVIASGGRTETFDWKAQAGETLYLSGAANGSPVNAPEYAGTGCTIWWRDFAGLVDWDAPAFASTSADDALLSDNIWGVEETIRRIKTGDGHRNHERTYGPGGDYANLKAGQDALLNPLIAAEGTGDTDDIHRTWHPLSQIATLRTNTTSAAHKLRATLRRCSPTSPEKDRLTRAM